MHATLTQRARRVQHALNARGVQPVDMRRAGTLETDIQLPAMPLDGLPERAQVTIQRLEGPTIQQHAIDRTGTSKFRWFLDGSQKSYAVFRIGIMPIVAGVAIVGIIERDGYGDCLIVPESLREQITWFVPRHTQDREVLALLETLHEQGEIVVDPLDSMKSDLYQATLHDYGRYLATTFEQASRVRAKLEDDAAAFGANNLPLNDDAWMLLDGQLRSPMPHQVGLIKSWDTLQVIGQEALNIYSLEQGSRSSAYHDIRVLHGGQESESELKRTMWFQRMWAASGVDARFSLIRIETHPSVRNTGTVSEIASWLYAERIPRPTADSRWPTLLYPIHLLENTLKRRIASLTVGWPS